VNRTVAKISPYNWVRLAKKKNEVVRLGSTCSLWYTNTVHHVNKYILHFLLVSPAFALEGRRQERTAKGHSQGKGG